MTPLDRRRWIAGAAALAAAPSVASAAPRETRPMLYDYLFLELPLSRETTAPRLYAERVRKAQAAIVAAGGEVLGLFTSQLGWRASEVALLLRWQADTPGRQAVLADLRGGVRRVQQDALTPTARPSDTTRPGPGGIYVHRWFVIDPADQAEFVDLSVAGWRDFEVKFDAKIFGLMAAERTAEDLAAGVVRILLLTRYGSHGVWEASRDPTTEAMANFARRRLLTKESWAASTLIVPLQGA